MNKLANYSKQLTLCLIALLLPALMVGCGDWKGDGNKGNKTITAFSLAGIPGTIDEISKNIAVTVPFDTDVTTLTATYSTTGTEVKVGATVQTSGITPNNFTDPVKYTVTADNGKTSDYNVIVTVAPDSAKAITAFSFVGYPGTTGIINEVASPKTIAVTVPFGTNLNNLTATFTTTGTDVKVGAAAQTSGATSNDFTDPVKYTVTAADGTTADYNVIVTVAAVSSQNPTAPALGETARFVILASQKITTTAGSVINNGDLGIKDQARTYYEGFTSGANPGQFDELINGLSYAHDDTYPSLIPAPYASTITFLDQVRTDLGIAYNFLAADPNPGAATQVCPTELGSRTLTRGVYKTASDVTIQTGTLTLDAQNDPNSVWILQSAEILPPGLQEAALCWLTAHKPKTFFGKRQERRLLEQAHHFTATYSPGSRLICSPVPA